MNGKELVALLTADLEKYLPMAAESIRRNRHMNEAGDLEPGPVDALLRRFVAAVPAHHAGGTRTLDVLEAMASCARSFVRPGLDPYEMAAVVDFVNYVGGLRCVDYAMYTKDL